MSASVLGKECDRRECSSLSQVSQTLRHHLSEDTRLLPVTNGSLSASPSSGESTELACVPIRRHCRKAPSCSQLSPSIPQTLQESRRQGGLWLQ